MTLAQYLRLIVHGRTPIVPSAWGASYNCTRCGAHLGNCPEQPSFFHRDSCTWAAAIKRAPILESAA